MTKTTTKQTMKSTTTTTTNKEPCNSMDRDDSTNDDSNHLFSDDVSIPSLSVNDSVPALCTRFKIKPEIDVAVESYSTAQIQVVDDSTTSIIMKDMIKMISDLRLFEGNGCQPMLDLD